ncbi:MAG: competence/damage-inducible protein A [Methylococcaceae bacterium]|nr:competence/damage-inducible protein A [Methylococcaceae bacterium]
MNPILEVFSQGEEIVTGQTVDTNAAWLSQQAVQLGFTVSRHTVVGDKLEDLVLLLNDIAQRADCCICTGGLGPTSDDLTAEAVANAFQRPLQFDESAYTQMKDYFANRNKSMPETNRKQALLPQGAERIDNDWGTAPGFALQQGRCWFAFLPGVPMEMRFMFTEKILPSMNNRFSLKPSQLIILRTIGMGESDIQERIKSVQISDSVQLGFRADTDEVQVKLLFASDYPETAIQALVSEIAAKLGDNVFSIDGQSEIVGDLVSVVDQLMRRSQHTLAVIETASQGLIAAKCINASWLLEAQYQQSFAKLMEKWAIQVDTGDPMSTAKAVAGLAQKNTQADLMLVQLYTGSEQHYSDKNQSITLFSVLLHDGHYQQAIHTIAGPVKRKQNQSALLALDLLRRYLQSVHFAQG